MSDRVLIIADDADPIEKLGVNSLRDALLALTGKRLGSGIARAVYELAHDATKVLKIESTSGSFHNVIEWETWQALSQSQYAQYLAPCHSISPCGIALVQSRVKPLPAKADDTAATRRLMTQQLPEFLTDFKRSNYGTINTRLVCCDYGSNLLLNHGAYSTKMRRPRWHD